MITSYDININNIRGTYNVYKKYTNTIKSVKLILKLGMGRFFKKIIGAGILIRFQKMSSWFSTPVLFLNNIENKNNEFIKLIIKNTKIIN